MTLKARYSSKKDNIISRVPFMRKCNDNQIIMNMKSSLLNYVLYFGYILCFCF